MTGYVRKDTSNNIADGNIINAADLDAEFDGVQDAFNSSTGHKHDGTSGEGAPITVVGPVQDVVISATAITPKTTNTVDIGSSSLKFKDIFITGTATLPTVSATTGNITTVNATTVDTTNIEVTTLKAKDGTAAGSIADSTGVVTLASAVLTTADINGGTLDNVVIGGSTAAAASVTTLTTSSTVTLNGGTANGVAYLNGSKVLTTGSALVFDGTNLGVGVTPASLTNGPHLDIGSTRGTVSIGTGYIEDNGTTQFFNGVRPLAFGISGSEQMRLTSTGLGIGTSSPTNALSVSGNANITGNTTLGDASTDTVTVNGYMGVGGAASTDVGVQVTSSALSGTSQFGVNARPTFTSGATSASAAIRAEGRTAAAAFTASDVNGVRVVDATKGAGSTITNQHGLYIADQTQGTNNYGITSLVSSGSNKWNIYASGTAANYFAGNVGIGTSSSSAPLTKLHVREVIGGGESATLLSNYSTTTNTSVGLYLSPTNGDVTAGSIRAGVIKAINIGSGLTNLTFSVNASGADPVEKVRLTPTEAVFNDPGNDYDFRVESDTNTHAIFLDAGNSRVGINNSSPTVALDITGDLKASGNTTLGDATTDTVQVNGYMGVGGAGLSTNAIRAVSTALTGADQQGIVSTITGTSAATSTISAFAAVPRTAASVFTVGAVHGLRVYNPVQGAGSTIVDLHGVLVADQTVGTNNYGITSQVSSGTNKWNIYASGTAANYFAGDVGIGTTSPAQALVVLRNTGTSGVESGISVTNNVDSNLFLRVTGTGATDKFASISTTVATSLTFATNSTERMRINSSGNVGIGTSSPNASAILDAQSTTKGVRMPNMTTTQKNAIASPAAGLMVFDTTLAKLCVYSGAAWETITSI